jgi:hypothetical protein
MLPWWMVTRRPGYASLMVWRYFSARGVSREYPAATDAPSSASRRQMALPMPAVPPVTNATRFRICASGSCATSSVTLMLLTPIVVAVSVAGRPAATF